jgi:hypothetical protein
MRQSAQMEGHFAIRNRIRRFAFILCICLPHLFFRSPELRAQSQPPETVYLHLDRDVYEAGTTLWFKGYVFSDHSFSNRSTVMHVRLLHPSGRLLVHSSQPVMAGVSSGQILLPDTLRAGVFILQAFTPVMLGQKGLAVFEQRIFIAGLPAPKTTAAPEVKPRLSVRFFPESGTSLTGVPNRIAFRASLDDGSGHGLLGRIIDDSGRVVSEVASFREGMGSFAFTPMEGRTYSLQTDHEGRTYSFPLPAHESDGASIGVDPHPEGYVFTLHDRSILPEKRAVAVVGEMQGRTVFRVNVPADRRSMRGVIRTDPETIRSGILNFKVVNRDGMPLAERRVFVRFQVSEGGLDLVWDTLDFSPGSLNRLTLKSKDPLAGEFSVSVHDGETDPLGKSASSMLAELLLKPSLPGWPGEDADWYFSAGGDSSRKGLDLLLMTEGWSRIDWKKTGQDVDFAAVPADPGFIVLEGVLEEPLRSPDRRIMMLMEGSAFGRRTESADVDAKGRFRIDSLMFFGDANLSFFDPSMKKGKPLKVSLLSSPLAAQAAKSTVPSRYGVAGQGMPEAEPSGISSSAPSVLTDSAVAMREIVVTASSKSPAQRLNERYAQGFFADGEERLIDLADPSEQTYQQNIFEYLKFRVPGIQVVDPNYEVASMPSLSDDPFNDPQGYRVFYRQQPTVSSLGNIPMAVYLNEVQTSTSVVATIPANQFAMVKVFSRFAPAPGGGAGGALALYTKDPEFTGDGRSVRPLRYKGFDIVREFPDIDRRPATDASRGEAERRTFLWRPRLDLSKGTATLRFLSAGNPSRYRVSVRGMTQDGMIVSMDRIVQK